MRHRCYESLLLRSHESDEKYWGIEGKLCKNCYASVKSGIQEYDALVLSSIGDMSLIQSIIIRRKRTDSKDILI
jgi:hypothetical protein